jgi:hypothetical protein
MNYFKNLRWYRGLNRCRFYRSANGLTPGLFVVIGFSWWRGRVIFRHAGVVRRYRYIRIGEMVEVSADDLAGNSLIFKH